MFWRLIISLLSACPTVAAKVCDGWDCNNMPPSTKACDRWDCNGSSGGSKPCDSWDCGVSDNTKVIRETPKNFAQILRLKCESLPYKAFWDAKTFICVDIQPSDKKCMVLHFSKGKIGLDRISMDLRTKLDGLSMIAPTTAGTNSINCVWDFGFNCTNSTIVGDRCVDVVTNADTVINAASACSKKGFRLYVSHDDSDIQQLLGHLTQFAEPAFWIGFGAPSTTWTFDDGSLVDFFRWKAARVFSTVSQGGQFLSKPTDNVNIGYIDVQKSTVKAPYVCSRYIDSDYFYHGPFKMTPGKITDTWDNEGIQIKDCWDCGKTDGIVDGWGPSSRSRSSRY